MGEDYRYSRDIPAFPTQCLTAYFVLSPVSGVFCHRFLRDILPQKRRHGRGARTTRLRRTLRAFRLARFHSPDATASFATRANVRDDREASPFEGTGWLQHSS